MIHPLIHSSLFPCDKFKPSVARLTFAQPHLPTTCLDIAMAELYKKVGRGGAGNFYSKKNAESPINRGVSLDQFLVINPRAERRK